MIKPASTVLFNVPGSRRMYYPENEQQPAGDALVGIVGSARASGCRARITGNEQLRFLWKFFGCHVEPFLQVVLAVLLQSLPCALVGWRAFQVPFIYPTRGKHGNVGRTGWSSLRTVEQGEPR